MNRISSFNKLLIKLCVLLFFSANTVFGQGEGILLENVNLIDGTGEAIQTGKSIYILNGRIQAILNYGEDPSPNAAERHDLSGKYVLPGLIDSHVHFGTNPSGSDNLEATKKRLATLLQHGITGVRDMAGDTRYLSFIARQARLDLIESPDIYYSALMAGPVFFDDPRTAASAQGETPGQTAWMKAIEAGTDMKLAVAQAKGTGATGIKIYADLPAKLCQMIIEEAQAQDMKVWAHATVFPALPMDLVNASINSVSHAPLLAWQVASSLPESGKQRYNETQLDTDNPKFQKLLEQMNINQTFLDPTIKVYKERDHLYQNAVSATKAAYAAGVPMVVGTDFSLNDDKVEYFPLIDEMQELVEEVGIPAIEVIKAATLNPAKLLGIDEEVGSIAVGKKANLIVIDNNPLEDITHLYLPLRVMKNGVLVKQ